MRRAVFLVFFLIAATSARADCDHFKWKLDQEKTWFAQPPEPVAAGGAVAPSGAYQVALKPESAAGYVVAPKTLTSGAFGAILHVAAIPKPGLYQVTLSSEAWVDVIQNGARDRTRNVSRQRDCPSFKKSVRLLLSAGPAVVQLSGVAAPSVAFALAPAS